MADYGTWAGLGEALQTGGDAYSRAKKAAADARASKVQAQRQVEQDAMTKDTFDRQKAETTPEYDISGMYPNAPTGIKATRSELFKAMEKQAELKAQRAAKAQEKADTLKMLPTTGINMQDMSSLPVDLKNLEKLSGDIEANKDIVGPWSGRLAKAQSYLPSGMQSDSSVKLQGLQSQVDNLKQTIGKFKEGGVLRKEDEEKYNRILATVWDNPEVAAQKIENIHNEMADKYNATLNTIGKQGYKTAGLHNIDRMKSSHTQENLEQMEARRNAAGIK